MRFVMLLALVAVSSLSEGAITKRGFYCTQMSPARSRGWIIEDASLDGKNGKKALTLNSIGIGLLTMQGDGTASEIVFSGGGQMLPNPDYAATSAQWKKALAFPLPFGDTAEYVLHVHEAAFEGGSGDFKVRLRIIDSESGKETSIILTCNETSWESKVQWNCPKKLANDGE